MNFWMIFQVFGIVSAWSVKALADGKITITEAAELGVQLGGLLGIPTDINVPTAEAVELPPDKPTKLYDRLAADARSPPTTKPQE